MGLINRQLSNKKQFYRQLLNNHELAESLLTFKPSKLYPFAPPYWDPHLNEHQKTWCIGRMLYISSKEQAM